MSRLRDAVSSGIHVRRPIALLFVLTVLLVGSATPAFAYTAAIVSPDEGLVTSETDLTVRITRGLLEGVPGTNAVELRLGHHETTVDRVFLDCVLQCGPLSNPTSTWRYPDGNLTPAGDPFDVSCNGQYWLRVVIDNRPVSGQITEIQFQQPPPAATGLAATGTVGNVSLTWNPVQVQDAIGIAVSRKSASATTFTPLLVEPLAPDATSFVDTTVTAADLPVTYAVAVFRHDGKESGSDSWVEGCTDTATTIDESFTSGTYSLATVEAQVTAPSPSPSPSGSPSPSASPTIDPNGPASPVPGGVLAGGQTTNPVEQPTITPPKRPSPPPGPKPRYYGDNLGFNELLDFGDTPPITAPSPTPTDEDMAYDSGDDEVAVDVTTEGGIDTEALLEPFAFGLLLLSLAMHVRRWMNA